MSKRDVRADVLQEVCDVCCKHGLEHLTTKKLGEEARCSEAMIYYHFKSKQEILEATFLHIHGEIDAVFREHFIARGLVLERDTYNVCVETWMLYYGYWRDHPAQRAFYDAFIHSHYITNELWLRDNASYVFFTSMFGRLMGDVAQARFSSAAPRKRRRRKRASALSCTVLRRLLLRTSCLCAMAKNAIASKHFLRMSGARTRGDPRF